MTDLSTIPLEELIGDLIDARVDARSCRIILELPQLGIPAVAVVASKLEAHQRINGNLRQIEVITGELSRRGITYKSTEACP